MKKILYGCILGVCLVVYTCERDDICPESTPTTPRFHVNFANINDPETAKNVNGLTIYGSGLDELTQSIVYNSASNTELLPLQFSDKEERTSSTYIFKKDTGNDLDEDIQTVSNPDTLVISYIPKFEYISRACGFKSTFFDLEVSLKTDNDSDLWITDFDILNFNVANETEVHLRILH